MHFIQALLEKFVLLDKNGGIGGCAGGVCARLWVEKDAIGGVGSRPICNCIGARFAKLARGVLLSTDCKRGKSVGHASNETFNSAAITRNAFTTSRLTRSMREFAQGQYGVVKR